jgi:hypothetical protein
MATAQLNTLIDSERTALLTDGFEHLTLDEVTALQKVAESDLRATRCDRNREISLVDTQVGRVDLSYDSQTKYYSITTPHPIKDSAITLAQGTKRNVLKALMRVYVIA